MNLNNTLFGPLSKQYCLYFYLLSVLGFVFLVIAVLGMLFNLFSKKMDGKIVGGFLMAALGYGIFYFQSRLLYSMCSHSEGMDVQMPSGASVPSKNPPKEDPKEDPKKK
jgi:hypothetical protein